MRLRRYAAAAGRRLAAERGYTLTELIVVLAILVIVVTALTQLFVSASTAQVDMTRRFEAQQAGAARTRQAQARDSLRKRGEGCRRESLGACHSVFGSPVHAAGLLPDQPHHVQSHATYCLCDVVHCAGVRITEPPPALAVRHDEPLGLRRGNLWRDDYGRDEAAMGRLSHRHGGESLSGIHGADRRHARSAQRQASRRPNAERRETAVRPRRRHRASQQPPVTLKPGNEPADRRSNECRPRSDRVRSQA